MNNAILDEAYRLLDKSVIFYGDRPVGTIASIDYDNLSAGNYTNCFVRDFVVSALVFLADARVDIVRNFLRTTLEITDQEHSDGEWTIHPSVMPASFRVLDSEGESQRLQGDFGERAIGRVAPVDSLFWWTILLSATLHRTDLPEDDRHLVERSEMQANLERVLALCANDAFEVFPTLMVPDGAFMIDRPLGVHGHPLEIQILFYGALRRALRHLKETPANERLIERAKHRLEQLESYLRHFYWLDLQRLSEIYRFDTEVGGGKDGNVFNIHPRAVPSWVSEWLTADTGYLVGNLGPGRMDFRFFAQGNLLAILLGLTNDRQSARIMNLFEQRWDDLIGDMPTKLCYPALQGEAWELLTGRDPKNAPWSYHNGGNWPVLLWLFVAAALNCGRRDLAERAFSLASDRLPRDGWPEYYDGQRGRLIGLQANLQQTWSAAALILAQKLLDDPSLLPLLPE